MHRQTLVLLVAVAVIVCAGAILVPQWMNDEDPTLLKWSQKDEVDVAPEESTAVEASAASEADRSIVAVADPSKDESRVDVVLRGRVVDKFQRPVAAAKVWLEFGRAGQRGGPGARQRRVPDPVQTDDQGRFAFQGQAFRNLQVALRVRHASFAPGLFDKSIGEVGRGAGDIELGDLVMARGAELLGRVTDLEGNGVANANVVLQPENGNRMRFVRDRDELLPAITTDNNGWYRRPNVPAGEWSVAVTAKRHTEGRSSVFPCEDEQQVEVEDIRLGPGYEVTGWVRDTSGAPIAKAEVVMRSEATDRGGRGNRGGGGGGGGGGFGGFGRDHRATTDAEGRFFLEHLPASPMTLDANANGFLDAKLTNVDPTLGQPVLVAMQEGLRITGTAVDEDSTPVTTFAVRAIRVRGLPTAASNQPADGAARGGMEATMREMRSQWQDVRQRGEDGPGGQRGPGQMLRDLGKTEAHPRGEFVLTGLQEGVYEVHLQSNDHARYRSAEIELRAGLAAPNVVAKLDRGVYVAGSVVDVSGNPVREARVTLRPSSNEPPTPTDAPGRGQRNMQDMARRFANALASVDTTTDPEGLFVLKHVPRGTYRLQAEKEGFATTTGETFELTTDRSGFTLTLGPLGAIAGKVLGLGDKEIAEARVGAVPMRRADQGGGGGMFRGGGGGFGGPGFHDVGVAADGTYRIEDLEPGDYLVRSWIGSPQELMRELMPKFFDGSLTADVTVRASEVTTFDLAVTRPQVGTVAGSVLHNGTAASGFQVELTRNDPTTSPTTPAANGDRGGRGGGPGGGRGFNFGRTQQATVGATGEFKIANVTAGSYRLRVSSGRRGGTLHEETIEVATNVTTERSIVITTFALAGTLTVDDGSDPKTLAGNVSLLPGLTTLPENFGQWRRENTTFDARVQNGAFRFDALNAGNYLAVLTLRGRERTTVPLSIGPGGATALTMPVGKVTAATEAGAGGAAAPNPNAPATPRPATPRPAAQRPTTPQPR